MDIVHNTGKGAQKMTLNNYFDQFMPPTGRNSKEKKKTIVGSNEPLYIFDRNIFRKNKRSKFQLKYFKPLPFLHNDLRDYGIFFIGISGTGTSFHAHGEGWLGRFIQRTPFPVRV